MTAPDDEAGGNSVAGVSAPAFVERYYAELVKVATRGVAGVSAPAFVERAGAVLASPAPALGVAGVSAPAFVERPWRPPGSWGWRRV